MNGIQIAKVADETGMFLAARYPIDADAFDLDAALSDWSGDGNLVSRWVKADGGTTKVVVRHFTFAEIADAT